MFTIGTAFTLFSIFMRLLPHPPNAAPVAALALFAGVCFGKRWGWALPVTAMLVSDFFIGFYDLRLMAVVYASLLFPFLIGRALRRNTALVSVFAGSLSGSIFFFLTTNLAVWSLSDWYPHTAHGLVLSYVAGLPFFRNTLAGDLVYTAFFFGAYATLPFLKRVFSSLAASLKIGR